jgi:tRNA (cytidine/uridine-2'-O-)-methyltransferase
MRGSMEIALYQPDIAGNVGTTLRTAACWGVKVHIIEPCGFAFSDAALRRAGMDYAGMAVWQRHANWPDFLAMMQEEGRRLVLLSTSGATPLPHLSFHAHDVLIMGAESSGVPDHVHAEVDARVAIPMQPGFRSLNVAVAAGIALYEALRQTKGFPA